MKISKLTFYYKWFGKSGVFFFLVLNSIFNYKKIKLKFIYGWKNIGFYNKYVNIDYYNFRSVNVKDIEKLSDKEFKELESKQHDVYPMN